MAARRRQQNAFHTAVAWTEFLLCPQARLRQVIAAAAKALFAKVVGHALLLNSLQPRFHLRAIGHLTYHQTKRIARQRAGAQFTLVANHLQDLHAFQLEAGKVGHRRARHAEAQRLLGDCMAIFHAGIAEIALMHAEEFGDRLSDKTRVAANFTDAHQQLLAFAVIGIAEIFNYHEIFRTGFDHPGSSGHAVQVEQFTHARSAFTSSATASQAMPSPRPVKPSFSVVVALTLTSSMWQPRSSAMLTRICGTCGSIFGA